MSWIFPDLLMFLSSAALYLLVRREALHKLPPQFNNLAMFLVPLPIFVLGGILTHANFKISLTNALIILGVAVCFAYVSNTASLKSITLAPNAGYSLVISKSYVVMTTFLAIPLFGVHVSTKAVFAVLLIVGFSALILLNGKSKHAKSLVWLPLALVAFFGWGFLQLCAKYLFTHGVPTFTFLSYSFAIVSVCILIEMRRMQFEYALIRRRWQGFVLIGLGAASFNYFNFAATRIAPNVGYVNATNAASIAVVTIASIVLFHDEFSWRKLTGVLGVIAGLFLLFLG